MKYVGTDLDSSRVWSVSLFFIGLAILPLGDFNHLLVHCEIANMYFNLFNIYLYIYLYHDLDLYGFVCLLPSHY